MLYAFGVGEIPMSYSGDHTVDDRLGTLTHTVPAWFSGLAATTPLAPANEALRSALAGQPVNGAIFALIGWALLGTALAASAVIKARRLTAREVLSAIPGS